MQRNKSIHNLSEIEGYLKTDDQLLSTYQRILKTFRLHGINRMLNSVKSKGLLGSHIFQVLFVLPFLDIKNIYRLFHCGVSPDVVGDDNAYYRFMNNPLIPWRKITVAFVRQFINTVDRIVVDQDDITTPRCLICDDSLIEKTGYKIEAIGKVFDHCSKKYLLGFKLLVMGLWDGKNFIPLDFSIHHEATKSKKRGLTAKQLKNQHVNVRPSDSPGQERIDEVSNSKIEIAIEMAKRAVRNGFSFDYVLADSWFISEAFIQAIRSIKRKGQKAIHVIGLMKTNRKVYINNKTYMINKLPELHRKSIKYCKKLKCKYILLNVNYKGIDTKIYMVCMSGQQSWHALICTDKKLTFIKAMEIYQIRWSIEVFFKDTKQHLNLGKCQSTNFDAQIASISLTCMNYIALALAKRVDDYESIGYMFMHLKDLIVQDHLIKRIWIIIVTIYSECLCQLGVDLNAFISQIINSKEIMAQMAALYRNTMNLDYSEP